MNKKILVLHLLFINVSYEKGEKKQILILYQNTKLIYPFYSKQFGVLKIEKSMIHLKIFNKISFLKIYQVLLLKTYRNQISGNSLIMRKGVMENKKKWVPQYLRELKDPLEVIS